MFRGIYRAFSTMPQAANWAIRKYTPQDAAQIKKIAFPVLWDLVSIPPSSTGEKLNKIYRENIQMALEETTTITNVVFKEDVPAAGFISYHLSNKKCLVNPTGVIDHLAIHPLYRNQGLGTKLLNDAVCDLTTKGAHSVSLQITKIETADFYKRQGFKVHNYPDYRFNLAGRMAKVVNPSTRPILGPVIDRLSTIEKADIARLIWIGSGLLLLASLLPEGEKKDKSADPKH